MYLASDTVKAIKEIQKYLGALNYLPSVIPSGIYDENTRRSVEAVQKRNGITPTGAVDYVTFIALYNDYKEVRLKRHLEKKYRSHLTFPIKIGDAGASIRHINEMLSFLIAYYGMHSGVRVSNIYSKESADAVKTLRKSYLFPDNDYIDEVFLDFLSKEYAAAYFFKNNPNM